MSDIFNLISAYSPQIAAVLAIVTVVLSSGLVTTVLTQLMKLPFIPLAASKYPRITSIVMAIVTAGLATWLLHVIVVVDWVSFVIYVAVTAVVSWKIYDLTKAVVTEAKQA